MADAEQEFTEEFLAQLKARDERFALIDESLALKQEIRESKAVRIILECLSDLAQRAGEELTRCDPTDSGRIAGLQQRVAISRLVKTTISAIHERAQAAQEALMGEQQEVPDG